jgi:hypothetical protein
MLMRASGLGLFLPMPRVVLAACLGLYLYGRLPRLVLYPIRLSCFRRKGLNVRIHR